ncbi:MAG: glycosyl hydrolase [Gemmatimonadetes bacterium]|nr:glycosyl hydrolase [Gemmatimonadota bacterium]
MRLSRFIPALLLIFLAGPLAAQRPTAPKAKADSIKSAKPATTKGAKADTAATKPHPFAAALGSILKPRLIGPAFVGGRVSSIVVHPKNPAIWYIGASSGGVWKTENGGATFSPIFDRYGSYSIGTVVLDPRNPEVVWVGTGESQSQRSVSYGDGVYRSEDGGKSFKRMGLEKSEHIGKIVVDPRNSDVVYVAAQGPLWADGGDRGLYKTTDGGKTWTSIITVSPQTGVTDVVLDPRNPDVLIAATWQRRRHYWTLINGGPESSLQRSTDGGKTWRKISGGIPSGNLGKIGLAVSPVNPDVVYATVEAAEGANGIFRSQDGGITWERRSTYTAQPMYYAVLVADPHKVDRVYSMDVGTQVSDDGGATWRGVGEKSKHVDNHALWIDPANGEHLLNGNDGGLYESRDGGENWTFFGNLPIAQMYDIDVDNSTPFRVCGGTQDNASFCAPTSTKSNHGIMHSDWFITTGGDGFVSRIDPTDPNTIYSESQNGGMVRYDHRTGEAVGIRPRELRGEAPSRWNWDTPIIISPFKGSRLYTASQRLYKSDDRGDSWTPVSGDLTRQVNRDALPVMGKVWGPEAVAKHQSTAFYSNISQVAESPKQEGLLYVGSDDGLIQVSENGGGAWRKVDSIPGVPSNAYVQRLIASVHDAGTAFAAIDNHQNGDFAPYLVRTTDAGKTWTSIAGDLPKRGGVYAIAEDHVNPKILFAGTEFGAYVTFDGGQKWLKVPGLPTIMVRDIAIQRRDNAVVFGTFGRSIYVVDDYSLLRTLDPALLDKPVHVFPVADAVAIQRRGQFGGGGKASLGESFYGAANPEIGATVVYTLKEQVWKSLKEKRIEAQKAAEKANKPFVYPTPADFLAEAAEEPITMAAQVTDAKGRVWRLANIGGAKGMQRWTWDLRGSLETPADPAPAPAGAGGGAAGGGGGRGGGGAAGLTTVPPGQYTVVIGKRERGVFAPSSTPVTFNVLADPTSTLTLADRDANLAFRSKASKLSSDIGQASDAATTARTKLAAIIRVLDQMPAAPAALRTRVKSLDDQLQKILREINGDDVNSARGEQVPVSIRTHAGGAFPSGSQPPTGSNIQQYDIASAAFAIEYAKLKPILVTELPAVDAELDRIGAPATPGRLPR